MSITDVIVLGDANPDLILRGDVHPRFGQSEQLLDAADLTIGGSGAITACGLARLEVSTRLLAEVGDDVFGRYLRDALADAGVALDSPPSSRPTGLSVVLSDVSERATLTLVGAIDAEPPAWNAPADVPAARHLHVSSYFLQPRRAAALPVILPLAREAGLTISLDTNRDPAGTYAGLPALLPLLDVILPNADEALAMARALTPHPIAAVDDAAAALASFGVNVVVKDGEHGAVWCPAGGSEVMRDPSTPVPVVDTTGAGDSFNAGYLAAWLRGLDPREALRWGCVAGAANVQAVGGTAGQIGLDELQRRVAWNQPTTEVTA